MILFRDHKFDIRANIFITSIRPLIAFYSKYGFVKIATKRYQPPNLGNIEKRVHITNLAVNKRNKSYNYVTDDGFPGVYTWIKFL